MLRAQNAVIILLGTRFPENAGMIARACANFGCTKLRLVKPERPDLAKALPLAARIGRPVLENAEIYDNLPDAVQDLSALFGTSARLGNRRQAISPAQFASLSLETPPGTEGESGVPFGIIFGPEDRGLSNQELSLCAEIINIPSAACASSFNIAQAVLIILYELFKNGVPAESRPLCRVSPQISLGDLIRLEKELKEALIRISSLPADNPDYFFAQWHDMLARIRLRRNEHDALMGMCRQIKNTLLKEARDDGEKR